MKLEKLSLIVGVVTFGICIGTGLAQAQTSQPPHAAPALSIHRADMSGLNSGAMIPAAAGLRYDRPIVAGGRIVAGANGKLFVTDGSDNVVHALPSPAFGEPYARAIKNAPRPLTSDLLTWLEQEETPQNGTANEYFGYGLAMDGDTAFIAFAPGGGVNVYTYENGTWTLTQTIADPQLGDQFGIGMAIDGDEAIIGANTATVHGDSWRGAAYVYTRSNGTWSQSAMLTAADGAANDLFGQTVALLGTTALIASPDATVNGDQYAGKAYVFTGSGSSWSQQAELTASDAAASYFFGHTVGLSSEDTALIGSSAVAVGGLTSVGAVYAFADSGGTWSQTQEFSPSDANQGMGFGYSLSVDGDTALIGAGLANGPNTTFQGAAYIFTNSGGTWTQTQKLTASDGQQVDQFGDSVALSGTTAVIGAWFADSAQGKAYIFTNSGGTWSQTQELLASDGQAGDLMGYTPFATSNGIALVSAYGHNNYVGAAYFFMPSNLGLAISAPQSVNQGQQYTSQTIATNNASAASPAVTATVTVPAAASFISASASQGTCSEDSGVVSCDFGQINGNAGTATANVTLKATGNAGETINNTASVALATPSLTASAPTMITTGGGCPAGYGEYDGSLNPGARAHSPIYRASAGQENAILTGPTGFQLYVVFQNAQGRKIYRIPGNEVHRQGPAGAYAWVVKAGDTGGAYTLCVLHP